MRVSPCTPTSSRVKRRLAASKITKDSVSTLISPIFSACKVWLKIRSALMSTDNLNSWCKVCHCSRMLLWISTRLNKDLPSRSRLNRKTIWFSHKICFTNFVKLSKQWLTRKIRALSKTWLVWLKKWRHVFFWKPVTREVSKLWNLLGLKLKKTVEM